MKYLITPTLLNSWLYYLSSGEEWEDSAREGFVKTLRKDKIEQTEAMLAGIEFEDAIRGVTEGRKVDATKYSEEYIDCVNEIAEKVRGGAWQVKVSKEIEISGDVYLLYGRVDVLKGPTAYDIKWTGKYETGKYKDSAQHPLYLDCLETVPRFVYLPSDGKTVYEEAYLREDIPPVDSIVHDFVSWIQAAPEYGVIFEEQWKARY